MIIDYVKIILCNSGVNVKYKYKIMTFFDINII